jgi:hypothetical protein
MADNLTANPGAGGAVFATDEIGGIHYPRTKVAFGVDGAAVDVSASDPLPVVFASGTVSISGSVAVTQSGSWSIANITGTVSLPTGASTGTKQDTGNTSLASIDGKVPALGQALAAASVPVVLTAAQLATLTPVSTVTANQGGAPWSVSQSGTWNIGTVTTVTTVTNVGAVTAISNALPVGTNVIGRIGIDQTTPGTTNKVSIGTDGTVAINAALPAGTNNIGDVDVLTLPALPAGSNVIGHVITDSGSTTAVTGTVAVAASALPLPANAAQETGGALATIAAKDFSTETTLALIKAKTDNIDVALSTRTKPADVQHVALDSSAVTVDHALTFAGDKVDASGSAVTVATLPLPSNAAQESSGNLDTLVSIASRTDALEIARQAMRAQVAIFNAMPQNGFVPIEFPSFL